MGYGLFVKALIPNVRLVSYVEWFFTYENSQALFDGVTMDDHCRLECRNIPILQELVKADLIICPTQWQRQQFPEFIRDRIQVVFDGVDLDYFCPGPISDQLVISHPHDKDRILRFSSDQLLLTYGTRGMEPLRGFPEFMRAAAVAQQVYPELQVIIFGNDRSAYSYASPHQSGSWKHYLLEELEGQLDLSRLHFTGLLNYGQLVQLFRRSNLHCYFTRPYIVSWGVFQAAACGAQMLVNDFPGIDEVFEGRPSFDPVDLDNQAQINSAVVKHLKIRKQSHVTQIPSILSLEFCMSRWIQLIRTL